MAKNKNETSDYLYKNHTDILVYDLNGNVHTFDSKYVYSLSTLEAGERYLLEYGKSGSTHEAIISRNVCNMLKEIIMIARRVVIL